MIIALLRQSLQQELGRWFERAISLHLFAYRMTESIKNCAVTNVPQWPADAWVPNELGTHVTERICLRRRC